MVPSSRAVWAEVVPPPRAGLSEVVPPPRAGLNEVVLPPRAVWAEASWERWSRTPVLGWVSGEEKHRALWGERTQRWKDTEVYILGCKGT